MVDTVMWDWGKAEKTAFPPGIGTNGLNGLKSHITARTGSRHWKPLRLLARI